MPDPSQHASFYNDDTGFTVDDAPARCRDCGDSFPMHCGACWCCREAAAAAPSPAPERDELVLLHALTALDAVVDLLVCRAQLPMGMQQAPVAECACRDCETARILGTALVRLEAL